MNLVCFGLLFMVCSPTGTPPPAQVTVAVCPVTAPWSRDDQRRLAAELRALHAGSMVEKAVAEAISLRDQARACRAAERVRAAEGTSAENRQAQGSGAAK